MLQVCVVKMARTDCREKILTENRAFKANLGIAVILVKPVTLENRPKIGQETVAHLVRWVKWAKLETPVLLAAMHSMGT